MSGGTFAHDLLSTEVAAELRAVLRVRDSFDEEGVFLFERWRIFAIHIQAFDASRPRSSFAPTRVAAWRVKPERPNDDLRIGGLNADGDASVAALSVDHRWALLDQRKLEVAARSAIGRRHAERRRSRPAARSGTDPTLGDVDVDRVARLSCDD